MQNVAEIKRKAPVNFQAEFPKGHVKTHWYSFVPKCRFTKNF